MWELVGGLVVVMVGGVDGRRFGVDGMGGWEVWVDVV